MTPEEKKKFFDLPEDIAKCISSEGLIQSIINHPTMGLIFAYTDSQTGYDIVKKGFNGFGILESRNDRGQALLNKYQSWDPQGLDSLEGIERGRYMAKGIYLELLINQYINLENLNSTNFKALFARTLEVFDSKKLKIEDYGYFGLTYCASILARMMYLKSYEPFMSIYQSNSFIKNMTDLIGPSSSTDIDKVYELAHTYFETIK